MDLFDDGAPQCRLTTIADMASVPLDLSHLPEFAFTPRVKRDVAPPPQVEHPPAHLGPPVPMRENPVRRGPGKADPIWDTKFQTKFRHKKPVGDTLFAPMGAGKVIADFLERAANLSPEQEVAFLAATQHEELATTLEIFQASAIEARRLDAPEANEWAADIADTHLGTTPYGLVLEDGRIADMVYVANMRRRIEWEKSVAACGERLRAVFEKDRMGTLLIAAYGRGSDKDTVLALRRAVKTRWLEAHDDLPDADGIAEVQKRIKGMRQFDIDPEARRLYELSRAADDEDPDALPFIEDPDPGRVWHHADFDPQPLRSQYPFGACWRCIYPTEPLQVTNHRDCTVLGWHLFHEDTTSWKQRQTDIGYAGPSGQLGLDEAKDAQMPCAICDEEEERSAASKEATSGPE